MRITCPHCGARSHQEFTYFGDADVARPNTALDAPLDGDVLEDWMNYVYLRKNSPGEHREYWLHSAACRALLVVTRNVTTHEILKVEAA
ncbi:sarcosine oxidase subunit delta [Methylovirgula sp. 4M-Z18]|uniref:sarcosine oxidase subunit delta n=1 Tax=Methylovirgula sp. 4M-Z18 TaxID=2293567 RepID=UPI000E2ED694|nr:sarcosine oxidase subunit delta [Methylovirgula sp. 4M-Z18]RFB79368.1 sarcosine oxidase subunit delta [Methylovirgula sp. 4M-Z18]